MPTDHEQAFGAQILKKCFHAKISETFHPLPVGTHCAVQVGMYEEKQTCHRPNFHSLLHNMELVLKFA